MRGERLFVLKYTSSSSRIFGSFVQQKRAGRMERMESMEPISAYYTTDYPEIQPDSAYGSGETTENQAKTPPAPTYDEELVHKVWLRGYKNTTRFYAQELRREAFGFKTKCSIFVRIFTLTFIYFLIIQWLVCGRVSKS